MVDGFGVQALDDGDVVDDRLGKRQAIGVYRQALNLAPAIAQAIVKKNRASPRSVSVWAMRYELDLRIVRTRSARPGSSLLAESSIDLMDMDR